MLGLYLEQPLTGRLSSSTNKDRQRIGSPSPGSKMEGWGLGRGMGHSINVQPGEERIGRNLIDKKVCFVWKIPTAQLKKCHLMSDFWTGSRIPGWPDFNI